MARSETVAKLDPITFEVISHRISSINDEGSYLNITEMIFSGTVCSTLGIAANGVHMDLERLGQVQIGEVGLHCRDHLLLEVDEGRHVATGHRRRRRRRGDGPRAEDVQRQAQPVGGARSPGHGHGRVLRTVLADEHPALDPHVGRDFLLRHRHRLPATRS